MAIGKLKGTNIIFLAVVALLVALLFMPRPEAKTPKTGNGQTAASQAAPAAELKPDVPPLLAARYKSIAQSISLSRVKADVVDLSSYPSRMVGYPGCDKATDYVTQQFKTIGLEPMKDTGSDKPAHYSEDFKVTVPINKGSKLVVGDQEFPIYGLWPNLVRTSNLPPDGMEVHLIDGGDGKLPNFDGKVIRDSAALVDFNSGTEWLNAPRLGARALIFVEPDNTMRGEGEAKFSSIPVSMPRFWISKANAAKIKDLIKQGKAQHARLFCKMPWEKVTGRNIVGCIRGSDPALRDQWIVLHASYDATSVVPSLAPGAESASGVAGLLELARLYKQPQFAPKRSVMFVATSAHFQGLAGMREFIEAHIDSYSLPGTLDSIHSSLNKGWPKDGKKAFAWPPVVLAIVLLLIVRWIWIKLQGLQRRFAWVVAIPVLLAFVAIAFSMNLGASFRKGYDFYVPNPPRFYLWSGLDLSSQTKGVGLFYKGYFYDYREDIQGKFSDVASRARENSERIASTLGFFDQRTSRFADGVNPIQGKNWRKFIPGKFALDSEVVTLAGGKGVSFVSTDDGRPLVDTPFDTADKVNYDNLRDQLVMIGCLTDHWFRDTNTVVDEELVPARVMSDDRISVKESDGLGVGYVEGVYTDQSRQG